MASGSAASLSNHWVILTLDDECQSIEGEQHTQRSYDIAFCFVYMFFFTHSSGFFLVLKSCRHFFQFRNSNKRQKKNWGQREKSSSDWYKLKSERMRQWFLPTCLSLSQFPPSALYPRWQALAAIPCKMTLRGKGEQRYEWKLSSVDHLGHLLSLRGQASLPKTTAAAGLSKILCGTQFTQFWCLSSECCGCRSFHYSHGWLQFDHHGLVFVLFNAVALMHTLRKNNLYFNA